MREDLVLYLIINESLNMSCGKIAAQCGHAIHLYMNKIHELQNNAFFYDDEMREVSNKILDNHYNWSHLKQDGYTKIALKADEKNFNKIKEEYKNNYVSVIDAGLTEIPSGSETVIALFPMAKDDRSKTLKRLRLL